MPPEQRLRRDAPKDPGNTDDVDGTDLHVEEALFGLVIEVMTDFYAEPRDDGRGVSYVSEVFHTTNEKHKVKRRIDVSVRQLSREDRERS